MEHQIDTELGVVFTTATGVLTAADILSGQDLLAADPDFHPSMKQLVCMTSVTDVPLTSDEIRKVAVNDPFGTGSRRALVGAEDITFGMGRMYGTYCDQPGAAICVFRNIDDACAWLEIPNRER